MANNYPFQGPLFAVGEKVRVRSDLKVYLQDRVAHLPEDYSLVIEGERVDQVDVDPDGYPQSLDFSHQVVKIEGWGGDWFYAKHFVAVALKPQEHETSGGRIFRHDTYLGGTVRVYDDDDYDL